MAEDRIDSIIDLNATQAEVDALEKQVQGVLSIIKAAKSAGIGAKESTSLKETTDKTKEISLLNIRLAESHKQVEQLVKARFAAEAKLTTLQTDYAKATAVSRTEIQAKNRELKIEAELQLASTGSIGRAEAAIKKLTLERKNLNLFTAEGKKRLEEINVSLDKYTSFLKKNNDEAGKQRLNIGNYQGSAKIIVDALEKARAKVVQIEKAFGEMSPEGQAVRQEFQALEKITQNPQFLNVSAKIGDAVAETRFFTKSLIELERSGQGGSEAARELRAQLARLTDEIADTRAEVKALSSDTRGFDLFAGSVKFLAASWQTAAGAAQLFGGENEDVQKSIQRLVAIQSIAQGVQQVATELTTKGTAANKAYNFVLQQGQILFGKGATAAMRFGVALKSIAIIAVASVLFDIYNRLFDVEEQTYDTQAAVDKLTESFESQKKAVDDLNASLATQAGIDIEKIKQKNADKNKAESEQFEVEKKLKKDQIDNLQQLENEAFKKRSEYDKKVNLIAKTNQKLLSKEQIDGIKQEGKIIQEAINQRVADRMKAEEDYNLFLEQNQTKQIETTREKTKEQRDKAAEEAKRIADANRAAQFEIFKLEQELQADFFKETADNENKSYSDRLLALNQYAKVKQGIIDATADYELQNTKLTVDEIRLVEAKRIDASLRLTHELSAAIKQTVKDFQQAEPAFAGSVDGMTKSISAAIEAINKKNTELKETLEKNKAAIKDAVKQLISEVQGLIFDLFTADIDREKNAIQDRIDLLDKQKEKDIEVANQSITNAQDKAAAIAVIEARSQAQKEQLERRQRDLDLKRAKFERAEAIVNIIANTAVGVSKALASAPPPGNFILAAIVGAIGAVQLARTLAQPIPKFKQGGVHKGGLMEVGDGGRAEGILLPDGSLLKSPAKSTIMDAPAGTKIFPDYDKMMLNATITKVPTFNVKTSSDGTKDAIKQMSKDVVRAIKNQPHTTFKGEPRWKVMTRIGSTFRTYLDNNL